MVSSIALYIYLSRTKANEKYRQTNEAFTGVITLSITFRGRSFYNRENTGRLGSTSAISVKVQFKDFILDLLFLIIHI